MTPDPFRLSGLFLFLVLGIPAPRADAAPGTPAVSYSEVAPIFAAHCLDCHAAAEPEANLVMERFEDLIKGGESGPAIIAGNSSESLLVRLIEGRVEKGGKPLIMPPGRRKKLEPDEIGLIRKWIDAGAAGPEVGSKPPAVVYPRIAPKTVSQTGIKALAFARRSNVLAVARFGEVELWDPTEQVMIRRLSGHRGSVNGLDFSSDEQFLFAAAGEAAWIGEVRQWKVADGSLIQVFEGHRDALYSLAVSPDDRSLATGSYDQQIKIWDIRTGKELRTLRGHNGAVTDLAFRPDGNILASSSADRTVKLWSVGSGERRDTLTQPLKEVYAVAFSPDGRHLAAAGVDNRIRIWQISDSAAETTNPILESRFAHEAPILNLVFSSDGKRLASSAEDKSVKLWSLPELKEQFQFPQQTDWAPALALLAGDKSLAVGRLDGKLAFYNTQNGQTLEKPKPQLARLEPPGLQSGTARKVKLVGKHLRNLRGIQFHHPNLTGHLLPDSATASEAWAMVTVSPGTPRGPYELSVTNGDAESGRISVHVEGIPQWTHRTDDFPDTLRLPASVWAVHNQPGDEEEVRFQADAGQTVVFEVSAKRLGSKAEPRLTLLDSNHRVLANTSATDGSDPILIHTFTEAGDYRIRVSELLLGASPEHFYRLSIGSFPTVTGFYPLGISAGKTQAVHLVGANLPSPAQLRLKPERLGEIDLPLEPEIYRVQKPLKILVTDFEEAAELEPNDRPEQAQKITPPVAMNGRLLEAHGNVDLFQFQAKAGQKWIIETMAAQRGSPADTRLEVLQPDGKPVPRLQLQAVRNSAVTFRGIDSNTPDCRVENWEEMELNQYLYLQGEVVKLFRAPQGPDSGFLFYTRHGKRRTYFDTTPTAHANDAPCYIVEPHPPQTRLAANGLPTFWVYYENDDESERKLGTDSRIYFEAPQDGAYLVRVTDARGYGGERFAYRLVVRESRPDFEVRVSETDLTVPAGSGQAFSVVVERIDGFEGEIRVELSDLPPGFEVSTPLVIEAGHQEAKGVIFAAHNAAKPDNKTFKGCRLIATATVDGRLVRKEIQGFSRIGLVETPKLFVSLLPDQSSEAARQVAQGGASGSAANPETAPLTLTLAPGQTIPARLQVRRNGYDDLVTFTIENLPHGVIVDNIGLNGVLLPKGETERQIFLTAARWVPDTDRLCFAVEGQAGRQASRPVLLKVRR